MTADISTVINFALLAMLLALFVAIARIRSLMASILLMGVYSLVTAIWLVVMDAPDVAFTEAVVGAGVSTLLLLGAILLTRSEAERGPPRHMIWPGLAAIAAAGLLIYAAASLPEFGDPSSPPNGYVGKLYLQQAHAATGIPNVVTAVLASYRGFDTLGETTVIFAGGVGVALLLGFGERSAAEAPPVLEGEHHVVLSVAAKLLIPVMALYAFYVQFHGDLGPGGGFQAGVILGVAVILHALVFGLQDTMRAITPGAVRAVASLGVLVYAGIGLWTVINGGAFLDYGHLFPLEVEANIPESLVRGTHNWGQLFGVLGVETGVFLTVAATMITLFYGFAGRSPDAPQAGGAA